MGELEETQTYEQQNMIETQTTTTHTQMEETPKEDVRFPGKGQTCVVIDSEQESSDFEFSIDGYVCPICEQCGCKKEECEMEIERQEYMAEYWADF